MKQKQQVESDYELELERIVSEIKNQKAKLVCIQLPDGLKKKATAIADYIEKHTKAKCLVWLGSCFGACDIPNLEGMKKKVDLLIQFGHSKEIKKK